MSAPEQRHDRDLVARRTSADAIRPLVEAVRNLEEGFGALAERVEEQAEADRRADRTRKLEAMVKEAGRNVRAKIAADERREERTRLELGMFGARLPRTFRERVFGVPDEESKP